MHRLSLCNRYSESICIYCLSPLAILKFLHEYSLALYEKKQVLYDMAYRPIFFLSTRELVRRMNDTEELSFISGAISSKLSLLCYLGLIERLPDHEVQQEALKLSRLPEFDYRGSSGRFKNSRGNRISFYRIPYYDERHLETIKRNIERWDIHQYALRTLNYDTIKQNEGQGVADQIYAGRHIRKKPDKT